MKDAAAATTIPFMRLITDITATAIEFDWKAITDVMLLLLKRSVSPANHCIALSTLYTSPLYSSCSTLFIVIG